MSTNEKEEEMEASIALAELLISLASQIAMLDGKIDEEDEEIAGGLIDSFFGDEDSLFPEGYLTNEDEVMDILTEAYEDPYPMEEIIELGKEDEDLANIIWDTADTLISEKGTKPNAEEQKFLDHLKKELKIK